MAAENESWEYTTLSKNAGSLAGVLSTFNIARTLADELKDAGVIGNALRDRAYITGADVTERMRVRPIIDGMLAKIRQNKTRYKEFRDVLLKLLGNDKDAVEPFIPGND